MNKNIDLIAIINPDFPKELLMIIKDFLCGNLKSQKKKFDIILKENNCFGWNRFFDNINLDATPYCNFSGQILEIKDESYCKKCGEKTMFPFTRLQCETCEYFETNNVFFYPYFYPMHQYF
tara:strand:- start:737 stop:1099 length:363 start_codon:yes stop_codon:yes gene_type:complete